MTKTLYGQFYSASAMLAMQTAVIARAILSVRYIAVIAVFCSDEYDRAVLTSGRTILLVSEEVKFIRIFAGNHSQRGR